MWNNIQLFLLIICLLQSLSVFSHADETIEHHKPQPTPYTDWDYIMFSQRWPISACLEWLGKGNPTAPHTCNLPKNISWIVHGLWPTKTNCTGPQFCSSSIHYDPDQIKPLLSELNEHWTDVEAGVKSTIWNHEWNKHGTCACVLPELSSVTNYFTVGLQLNHIYNVLDILNAAGLRPGDQSHCTVQQLQDILVMKWGKKPQFQCVTVHKRTLISEVRLCFNKSLDLIDCDETVSQEVENCGKIDTPLMYLSSTNSPKRTWTTGDDKFYKWREQLNVISENDVMYKHSSDNDQQKDGLVNDFFQQMYRWVNVLKWFTF